MGDWIYWLVSRPGWSRAQINWEIPVNINQGNILTGDMGIGLWNVMFYSDTVEQQSLFEFNDTIFNGIAFWTLGDGSGSNVNNSQGCVQRVFLCSCNSWTIRMMRCYARDMSSSLRKIVSSLESPVH